MRRTLAITAAAAVVAGGAAIGASADTRPTARSAQAKPKVITFQRVGQVHIGDTHAELRDKGLVGKLRPGCELGGPNTRSSRLRSPLSGQVDYTLNSPRKVVNVTVRGGAEARGVGIGDRISDIKAKFPKAIVDHSTEEVFELTLVRVPKNGGGRIHFAVPLDTKRISLIGIPFIAFCE